MLVQAMAPLAMARVQVLGFRYDCTGHGASGHVKPRVLFPRVVARIVPFSVVEHCGAISGMHGQAWSSTATDTKGYIQVLHRVIVTPQERALTPTCIPYHCDEDDVSPTHSDYCGHHYGQQSLPETKRT